MIFKKRALFLKKFIIPLFFKGAKSIALKNRALINAGKRQIRHRRRFAEKIECKRET